MQGRAARYTCNRFHNTSSVSEMLQNLNWQTLQEQRPKIRLQMFHKVINNEITIPSRDILIKSQSKTRTTHQQTCRQLQCNKDSFKFFSQTIKDWNKLLLEFSNKTSTDNFKDA